MYDQLTFVGILLVCVIVVWLVQVRKDWKQRNASINREKEFKVTLQAMRDEELMTLYTNGDDSQGERKAAAAELERRYVDIGSLAV